MHCESHVSDWVCKQDTAPRAGHTRNIFSCVAQDTSGDANVVSCERIVCRSRASCLSRTRQYWIFHLSQFHRTFTALLLPYRDEEQPLDPRTAGLFGRLALKQSPLTLLCGLEAVVYAHNHHMHTTNDPGDFEDCMQGGTRLMRACTPAYAHAFQSSCIGRCAGDNAVRNFKNVALQG